MKVLRFSLGMEFNITGGDMDMCNVVLAISALGGICNCIGRWSELRWMFWFVAKVD